MDCYFSAQERMTALDTAAAAASLAPHNYNHNHNPSPYYAQSFYPPCPSIPPMPAPQAQDIMSLSTMIVPATPVKNFPETLFHVISSSSEQQKHADVFSWLPHGRGFIIHDKQRFASTILPKYFEGAKWPSFTRRLKRWGFVRVSKGPEMGAYYNENFVRGRLELVEKMGYEMEGRFRIGEKNKKRKSEDGKKENELKVLRGSESLSKEGVKVNDSLASVTSQENYTTPHQNQVMGRGNASKEEDQVNDSSALSLMTSQKDYMPHRLQVLPASAPNEVHYTNPQDRSMPFPSSTQPIIPIAAKTTATHYTPYLNQVHPVSISNPAFSPMRRTNPQDRPMASLHSALPTEQAAIKTTTTYHHHSAAASETHVDYSPATSNTASNYSGNPELVWPRRHLMERQRELQLSAARPMPMMTYEAASVAGYKDPVGYTLQARVDADVGGPPSNHPVYTAASTAFPNLPATIGYAELNPEIECSTNDPSPASSIGIQVPVDSVSDMSAYYTAASIVDQHMLSAEYAGQTAGTETDFNINVPTPTSNIIQVPVDNGGGVSTYYTAASTTAQNMTSANYAERILETERNSNHGGGPFPLYPHQNIINNSNHVDQDLIAFHDSLARTTSKLDLNNREGLCEKQVPITEGFGGSTGTGGRAVMTSQEEEWKFDIVDIQ